MPFSQDQIFAMGGNLLPRTAVDLLQILLVMEEEKLIDAKIIIEAYDRLMAWSKEQVIAQADADIAAAEARKQAVTQAAAGGAE